MIYFILAYKFELWIPPKFSNLDLFMLIILCHTSKRGELFLKSMVLIITHVAHVCWFIVGTMITQLVVLIGDA